MLYRDLIIDLSKNPLNKREISDADYTASGANPVCGDRVRMYAKKGRDGELADISFEGYGCAISTAAASLVTEEAKEKSPEEIAAWGLSEVCEWLGTELSVSRVKCGLIALETLQLALNNSARTKESHKTRQR